MKQAFDEPVVTTYERDELVMETVFATVLYNPV